MGVWRWRQWRSPAFGRDVSRIRHHSWADRSASALWKLTTIGMGLGELPAARGGVRRVVLGLVGPMAHRRRRRQVHASTIGGCSSTMSFVFVIARLRRRRCSSCCSRWLGSDACGVTDGHRAVHRRRNCRSRLLAAVVQQCGIGLHQHFNHNDLMHVIQMGGVWLLYMRRRRGSGMQEDSMAVNRREFLKTAGLLQLRPPWPLQGPISGSGTLVNDIHSQLNPTRVREIVPVDSTRALQRAIKRAAGDGHAVCIAGGRHAMGAQQFASDAVMLDTTKLNRVHSFDRDERDRRGGCRDHVAGADQLSPRRRRPGRPRQWGIAQKQTGADRLTIGGALAANVHGRGLKMKPFIADVESFDLIDARGEATNLQPHPRTPSCSALPSAAMDCSARSRP